MTNITPRQRLVLDIIKAFQLNYGAWPSLKDIRTVLGVSSDNGVLKHLDALEEKGYIDRPRNSSGNRVRRMMRVLHD